MKKFFSLMCAIAIVFSASAAQVEKPAKAKSFQAKEKAEHVAPQKRVAQNAAKMADFTKQVNAKEFNALQVSKAEQVFKARKAAKVAEDVEIVAAYDGYAASYGIYYYALMDEDGTIYYFSFASQGADPVVLGQTYTLADMESDYSYYDFYGIGWFVYGYASATFTKTVSEEGKVQIAAYILDEAGYEYNLSYDEANLPEAPHGGTYVADEGRFSYSEEDGDVQYELTVSEEDLVFYFDILLEDGQTDVVSGQMYTDDDMDMQYTGGVFGIATEIEFDTIVFEKTVLEDGAYNISVFARDVDGYDWNISFYRPAPSLRYDTLTMEGKQQIASSYTKFSAYNADSSVYVTLYLLQTDSLEGNFTGEDFYKYLSYVKYKDSTITYYSMTEAEIEIAFDTEANAYLITGTMMTMNDDDDLDFIQYDLHLTMAAPVIREETIEVANGFLTIYESDQDWQVVGFNADSSRYVALDIKSLEVAGEYTEKDVVSSYTAIMNVIVRNDSLIADESYSPLQVAVTVTFNAEDSTAMIVGTYFGQGSKNADDYVVFTLNIAAQVDKYIEPEHEHIDYDEEDADFIHDFANYEIDDRYLAQYGVLFIAGENANGEYLNLELWLPEGADALVAGVYPVAEEGTPQSITDGSLDTEEGYIYGSFAGILTAQGSISNVWFFVDGTATVNADGSIDVEAVNSYDRVIRCHLAAATGVENVEAGAAAVKRMVNGVLVIEKNGVQYNAQGAVVK